MSRGTNSARVGNPVRVLALDIGGTGLKASVVDRRGRLLAERRRIPTPHPCPPERMLDALAALIEPMPPFNRIAIGFPGYVRDGHVVTAPNLGSEAWAGYPLERALSTRLGGHPARLVNDAEMQGLAVIEGRGIEMILTLGTGAGTGLYRDGEVMPHLELAHHPFHKGLTYEQCLGDEALHRDGKKRWNRRLAKAIETLRVLLNYDRLYLGGGNSVHVALDLPGQVRIVSNDAGLEGGGVLWRRG